MIYLDYAASFPPFPEAISDYTAAAVSLWSNPGAIHAGGAAARSLLHSSRRTLARLLQVRPEEIFFTSGATEANNWAVKLGAALHPRKRHILCSATEHSSVLESLRAMERSGWSVTWLKPDAQGRICPRKAAEAIRSDTALLCVQAVNNETGVIQDVDALAQAARSRGCLFFCDAVQSFGHITQNLHRADLISLSAHKLGGPRGVGCLVIRQPSRLSPLIHGGGQEFGLRSGTENLPAIAGFARAAQISLADPEREQQRLQALQQQLREGLEQICPGLKTAGKDAPRVPGILCCAFPGFSGEEMAIRLDLKGICVSPGAACSARNHEPSHVLLAMGFAPREAAGFLRFSLGPQTTPEEIQYTLQVITQILS